MDNNHPAGKGGNIVASLLIVIAVGLFALLSYTVINTVIIENTGVTGARKDAIAQLVKFPGEVQHAVNVMLKSGIKVSSLNFGQAATGTNAVFEKVEYAGPQPDSGIQGNWNFRGRGADGSGWFVSGIGTDGPDGKDVFAYLSGLSQADCEDINKALDVPNPPLAEKTPVNLGKKAKKKDIAGDNAWSFNAWNAATPPAPKPAACVQNGKNAKGEPLYIYYHVIVAK
ncbi:MAG TPA: hypothetical protein VEF76_04380 [Patescibacteria group bacterium]|nr:hypothetical protein [Patescibacteria group bacterium]